MFRKAFGFETARIITVLKILFLLLRSYPYILLALFPPYYVFRLDLSRYFLQTKTKPFLLPKGIFRLCSRCSIRRNTVAITTSLVFTKVTKKERMRAMEVKSHQNVSCVYTVFLLVRQQPDALELQFLKLHSGRLFLSSNAP